MEKVVMTTPEYGFCVFWQYGVCACKLLTYAVYSFMIAARHWIINILIVI